MNVPGSPAITRVFVISVPTRPMRPVRGTSTPCSAGWSRTLSGVSPCGICQRKSPVDRSMAVMRPHGGLTSGSPRTFSARRRAGTPGGLPRMKFMSDRSGSFTSPSEVTCVKEY